MRPPASGCGVFRESCRKTFSSCTPPTVGPALLGDRLYVALTDCFLVALDARTGEVIWEVAVDDYQAGYYMTLAPLAAKGKIMVGVSGGEYGIRGYIAAYDAETGDEAWRTYTVPAPGEPGSDTWPEDDAWKTGGGSVWLTGNYDPETGISYWGIGNAAHLGWVTPVAAWTTSTPRPSWR